ncbi:uncharacterized protein LOC107484296 [Arachis duranensis]|uniref:Uncharacterized protein LOC107484296 n=1 Tax=Arachis duranensis TaxID=130453 RepID=A0A6P4D2M8_ARADU|nr:uncharacterized protein LOC107484296 [Arachis duranensis]
MPTNVFPNDTMTNPSRECKAITLRSEKVVKDASSSHNLQEEEDDKNSEIKEEEEIHIPTPPKEVLNPYVPKAPYPQRLRKDRKDSQFSRFLEIFKRLQINIPFAEALEQMPLYAKFLKELMTKKRNWGENETVVLTEDYSAIIQKKLPQMMKDPRSFHIPCIIGDISIKKILCDLGASINLMSLVMMKRMIIEEVKLTRMALQLADRTFKFPHGVVEDLLVKGELVLKLHKEKMVFNVFTAMSYPKESIGECMMVDTLEILVQGVLKEDKLEDVMEIEQQASWGELPQESMDNLIMLDKASKEKVEVAKLELKTMPPSLKYAYLGSNDTYPVIINSTLSKKQEEELIKVLKQHKDAIGGHFQT